MTNFKDGYIAAIRADLKIDAQFSDEALGMILGDCKTYQANRITGQFTGEGFWRERQKGHRIDFPPLTPYLGDDGKIYLRLTEGVA